MKLLDANKGNAKPFLRIAAFLLALIVIIEALSLTVFSKGAAATYNNKYANQFSFLQEPDDSVQLAFIGDSNIYSAVVPIKLWEWCGLTSTIIAAPKQTLHQSYHLLEDLFEKQSPQYVVVETDMFYRDKPIREDDTVIVESEKPLDVVFDTLDPSSFEDVIKGAAPVFTFHDKWKSLLRGKKVPPKDANAHGYHLSLTVRKFKLKDYMKPADIADPIKKKDAKQIDAIVSLCRRNGAEVVFVTAPSPVFWSYERHNATAQLAKQYGADYIDYNLMWDELGLSSRKHFRDKGHHLNYFGAKLVTKQFGGYARHTLKLKSLKNDARYSYWDDSTEAFKEDVDALIAKINETTEA